MTIVRKLTLTVALVAATSTTAFAAQEITGAAILEHPAAKVAMQNMSLMHAGKIDEAVKMGTTAMQADWAALPAEDRTMMSEMMKAFAVADDEFRSDLQQFGTLTIDGERATLLVKKETKDENGSGTETKTVHLMMEDGQWRVTRGGQH